MCRLLLLLGFTACLSAAEKLTQHAFDTSLKTGAWDVMLHSRMRTTPEGGGVAQVRFGPIVEWSLPRKFSLIAGYYFTRDKEDASWSTTHRPFGGVKRKLVERKQFDVEGRSLFERFLTAREPDYFRVRSRLRLSTKLKTAPYTTLEYFHDRHGFRSVRYSAGLSRKLGGATVDVGYFFEHRRLSAGGNRHMFLTTFHWRNGTGRLDPDL